MQIIVRRIALAICVAACASPAGAVENIATYRVVLNDGTAVVSYGECALVGDRVVFSMPIGINAPGSSVDSNLHIVNIAAAVVNWPATTRYAESVRLARYVTTSAAADYAALTTEMAGVLNS